MKSDSQHFAAGPPSDANHSPAPPVGFEVLRRARDQAPGSGAGAANGGVVVVENKNEALERRVEELSEKIAQLTALMMTDNGGTQEGTSL